MTFTADATANLNHSVFAGMPPQQLAGLLASAQVALVDLQLGRKVVTVSYNAGNGQKHTTFTPTDAGKLTQLILEMQACLGLRRRGRTGFRVNF